MGVTDGQIRETPRAIKTRDPPNVRMYLLRSLELNHSLTLTLPVLFALSDLRQKDPAGAAIRTTIHFRRARGEMFENQRNALNGPARGVVCSVATANGISLWLARARSREWISRQCDRVCQTPRARELCFFFLFWRTFGLMYIFCWCFGAVAVANTYAHIHCTARRSLTEVWLGGWQGGGGDWLW